MSKNLTPVEKFTAMEEKRIFNEYIVADYNCRKRGTVTVTLVPTYATDAPKQITLDDHLNARKKMLDTDSCIWNIGSLVTLTKDGKIKPVKYDMRKCDTMLVTGAQYTGDITKELYLVGKKFGNAVLFIRDEPMYLWHQKFYGTERGDIVLVRPTNQEYEPVNTHEILRKFTTEEQMRAFFQSQHQR